MNEKKFEGIFAALTTPFMEGELALNKFIHNLNYYNQTSLAGYVVLGSTGEAVFLGEQEAFKIVSTARENLAPGKKLIAGASRESVKETINFINQLAELGAEAALVKPPYYYKPKMTREALKTFFLTVADQAKIPIIIYHIPQNTGLILDSELIIELALHPQIIGMKDSSGNLATVGEVVPAVKSDFCFLTGAGSILFPSLQMGACGAILAVATVIPEICCRLYNLFRQGQYEEALAWQIKIIPLNKALTQTLGIPAIKYALDLIGLYGGEPRLPLLPLSDQDKEKIKFLLNFNKF
ncbi:MAG: dihydrodipicolinate synthase family protein [Candidatus Aminicenantes bacterium]|nr:dihydrodipicolinate synthase family protein [Candidatus Aminicenantes bacterium]